MMASVTCHLFPTLISTRIAGLNHRFTVNIIESAYGHIRIMISRIYWLKYYSAIVPTLGQEGKVKIATKKNAPAKKVAPVVNLPITAYKAFGPDWKCRNFQYEIGKTYEHEGDVKMCDSGFHACAVPFDCWSYYSGSATFARVSLSGASPERRGDSKICAAKITIEASMNLPEWIKAQVEAVLALCKSAKGALSSDKKECAAATGYSGHAAATGNYGHAAATGNYGHAAATGYSGHAAATGNYGHAAATGNYGHAAATGNYGHAAATGYSGHAAATGNSGHAAATGDYGHAAATGYSGHAAATGYSGHAAATGYSGHAAATGNSGHAAATGNSGHAAATGNSGHAAATGNSGHAAATGDSGHAAATGNHGHAAATGDYGAAFAGFNGRAKASASGSFAIVWFDEKAKRSRIAVGVPGEDGIEADKWYGCNAGKLVPE